MKEFNESRYVILGVKLNERVVSTPDDPDGVAEIMYSLMPLKIYKGSAVKAIKVSSENTSGRFIIEAGKKYLLFLRRGPEGLYVDSCGNSGELSDAPVQKIMPQVEIMARWPRLQ